MLLCLILHPYSVQSPKRLSFNLFKKFYSNWSLMVNLYMYWWHAINVRLSRYARRQCVSNVENSKVVRSSAYVTSAFFLCFGLLIASISLRLRRRSRLMLSMIFLSFKWPPWTGARTRKFIFQYISSFLSCKNIV